MKKKILAAMAAGVVAAVALAAPAQAATMEIDKATGNGITIFPSNCAYVYDGSLIAGTVCFQPEGDILQAEDNIADGHSVALRWYNYLNGSLHRQGACVESGSAGSVGKCNKDFNESSELRFKACTWESGPNTPVKCGTLRTLPVA